MIRQIEIEDSVIPDGWEPVAFRVPLECDEFVLSTGGVVERVAAVPDGPRLVVCKTTNEISIAFRGTLVLVSNSPDGPYVQRMLADICYFDKDYPYVCEAIDHRHSHQCWRYAKRLQVELKD